MRIFISLIFLLLIQGCTSMTVVKRTEKKNGYFYVNTVQSKIVTSIDSFAVDEFKPLLVVPKNDFVLGMSQNLEFFSEVITLEDLEKRIIESNLQENVPSINSYIGLSNAYKYYKPFLYLSLGPNVRDKKTYQQLKLLNPKTGKEIFLSEMESSYPNDQGVWYPLFNSFVDYLRRTSKSYK